MFMRRIRKASFAVIFILTVFAFCCVISASAETVTINFDDFPTPGAINSPEALIGNRYEGCGLKFPTSWFAYNADGLYPSHSGTVTAIGNPFPAVIDFVQPVSNVSAYFNIYQEGVTFSAYHENTLLGSVTLAPTTQPTPGGPQPYSLPYEGITKIILTGPAWAASYYNLDDLTYTADGVGAGCGSALVIQIDIKPGSSPNSINLRSRGNIPIVLLSSDTFNAASVDTGTVVFAGASALTIGGVPEDVNNDGLADLVLHFATQSVTLQSDDTEACLTGQTTNGQQFKGCDSVRVIK